MSSSDDSSSSDEGPRQYQNEGPSSHSGLSDEDDKSKNDEVSSDESSSDSDEKKEKSSTSSDDSEEDEDKEKKKVSSDSSDDDSEKEKDKKSPILDSSDEDEEEKHEDDKKMDVEVTKDKADENSSLVLSSDSDGEIERKKKEKKKKSKSPKLSTDSEDEVKRKKKEKKKKSESPKLSSDSEDEVKRKKKEKKKKSESPKLSTDSEDEIKPSKKKEIQKTPESPKLSTDSEDEQPKKKEKKSGGGDTSALPELSSDSDDAKSSRSVPKEESDDEITGPRLHPEYEEEELEPPQPPLDLKLPIMERDYGKNGPSLTRWPNFISVDTHPYNEEFYEPEEGDANNIDAEGRSRLQLKVENCIRWRKMIDGEKNLILDENGQEKRESNAKIVHWSDGSMTLNLGSEVYEITEQEIKENNQLFIPFRGALRANKVFKRRFAFRPITTDSMTHKKMTMKMAEKTNKSQKVKILANVGEDPEAGFANLVRKEEEKLRQNARKEAAQRKMKERQYRSGLTHGFLEDRDEEDEDPESLASIKRQFTHPRNRFDRFNDIAKKYYSSEEDDDDSRRIERSKIESDDEAEASTSTKKKDEKKKRKIVISDDED